METYLMKRGAHRDAAFGLTGKVGVLHGRHYACNHANVDARAGRPIFTVIHLMPMMDDGRKLAVNANDLSQFTRFDPHENDRIGQWDGMLADGWTLVQREDDAEQAIGEYLESIFKV